MATHTAADASCSAVTTAMGLCTAGDTLAIPSGTTSWSSTLTVSTAITVQGAGKTSTVISPSGTNIIIDIEPGSDKAIRVTAIGFSSGTSNLLKIGGSGTGAYALTQVRVDNCDFINGKDDIVAYGKCYACIDHNTFLNGNRDIFVWAGSAGGDYSWDDPISAGTSSALFIEDNTFTQTNAGGSGLNENIYHQGGRTVIRHNMFDASGYTSYDACLIDVHGNIGYWTGAGTIDRGSPIIEIYDNTFTYHHSYRVVYLRGGSMICHDNAFNYVTSSTEFVLSEEEDWQSLVWSPLRTVWPGQDQLNNCFFWSNTHNGSAISSVTLQHANDSTFIQENRDYFMHAPQSSGGYEYYTGTRKGGSTTSPTASDIGSMVYTSGANAYYSYSAYTYPHPLQGGSTGGTSTTSYVCWL